MYAMAPDGVSVHFSRMVATGTAGVAAGMADRIRTCVEQIDQPIDLLAMVKPRVIVLAFTAASYHLGKEGEAALMKRTEERTGIPMISAFGSAVAALETLGARKVALGTPYGDELTLQAKEHLQRRGFDVVNHGRMPNVANIYDETEERTYQLARSVDTAEAEAIFISGVGLPTVAVLETLERDLGKPVISASAAMMWNALRTAGVDARIPGYGRLFR
jgi:maleate cis-trans isomerase